MTPSNVETLGALFRRSVRLHPLATQAEAEAILGHSADRRSASEALFNGLVVRENTGIRKGFLDEAARHHFLAARVRGHPPELADAISNLSAYLPGVIQADGSRVPSGPIKNGHHRQPHVPAYLKRLDDRDAWTDALLVARASAMLNRFSFSVARTTAIADAADRMKARGYRFTVAEGRIEITSKDMVKIVRAIEDCLACLGSFNALQNLFTLALKDHVWNFEQILFGQRHAPGRGERLPSVPVGLLFNLAMKQNFAAGDPAAAGWAWIEAVTLSRDFVAMLDLETYTQFDHLGIDARNLEEKLRRITHSDHCFSLRQWDFSFTPDFLESFFGNGFDTNLKQECGWDVSDVLSLCKIVEPYLDKMPRLVAKESFYSRGLGSPTLQAIFRDFCHEDGQANADYRSPFDADGFDSIFKPFIMVHTPKGYSLLLPPKSLIGPAIYEAVFAAVKKPLSSKQVSDLRGAGTEGLTKRIFAKHGFRPSLTGAEYKLPEGYGECDFVFEDDSNILLVECKAKPLTRRAMTGGGG